MLRIILFVLALALVAYGQNEIGRSEVYNGRIATNCMLLPPAHPKPVLMRVAPRGQLLGYVGTGAQGEQALYFRSSACSTEPWQLFATASAFAGNPPPPSTVTVVFRELLLSDTAAYVVAGTPYSDGSIQPRWIWKLNLAANSKVLLAAEGETLGDIRPSLISSFTVTRTGEEIMVARVGNNRIFHLTGGQWQDYRINGAANRTVTGAFAHPSGLLIKVTGSNFQSDVLLWNGSSTSVIVDSTKQVLAEDLLSCCNVLNSQGLSLVQYSTAVFVPLFGRKLQLSRVAEVTSDGKLRLVLGDDANDVYSIFAVRFASSAVSAALVSNRTDGEMAADLFLWDGGASHLVKYRQFLFGVSVTDYQVIPLGIALLGGVSVNASTVDNGGTVYTVLRRSDFTGETLRAKYDSVVRLALPRPTSITPSPVQQGQDFTVTGEFLAFSGLKTDLLLGAGTPADACTPRSESELVCRSTGLPLGSYPLRVRIGGSVVSSTSVPITVFTPAVPTATLTVDPLTIQTGQSTVLRWITANATAVSINQGIGSVSASGSRTVAPSVTTTYTLTATGLGGTATARVTVIVTRPRPRIAALVNPFTQEEVQAIAPGLWMEIYGENIGDAVTMAPFPFPTEAAGVKIRINVGDWEGFGRISVVKPYQVNTMVPFDCPTSGRAMVTVIRDGVESAPVVLDAAPTSVGLLQNGNGAYNAGDVAVIYAVGLGRTTPPATTGQPAPFDQLMVVDTTGWTVEVDGLAGQIPFAGLTPGFMGLYQLNIGLAAGLPYFGESGPQKVWGKLKIGGKEYVFSLYLN